MKSKEPKPKNWFRPKKLHCVVCSTRLTGKSRKCCSAKCGYIARNKKDVKAYRLLHPVQEHICPVCSAVFNGSSKLRTHRVMRKHLTSGNGGNSASQ